MPSPALRSVTKEQPSSLRHTDVLRRCAEGDPNCLHDLEASFGARVRTVLTRALGSEEMAAFALPAVLADLRDRAHAFDPECQIAEDWVFGQLRRRLRELADATTGQLGRSPGSTGAAPLAWRSTAFRPGQPLGAKLRSVVACGADELRRETSLPASSIAHARATRNAAPVRRSGRRWSRRWRAGVAAAAVLAAAGVGVLMLPQRAGGPQVTAVPSQAVGNNIPARSMGGDFELQRPSSAPTPAPANLLPRPLSTAPPAASATARPPLRPVPAPPVQAGGVASATIPLVARQPSAPPPDSVRPQPSLPPSGLDTATRRPPILGEGPAAKAAATVSGATRVFIHHTVGSDPDAATSQAVAERLRGQGFAVVAIRPVPFAIRRGSVRYYFERDRGAARQLAALAGPLAEPGGPRPPLDFSHYQPKPSPGTVEVWIESR